MTTIYSTPKPFEGEMDIIQRNAILSWKKLGYKIALFGKEAKDACKEFKLKNLKVNRNKQGTPLISSIISQCQDDISIYVNADIILLPSFAKAVLLCQWKFKKFLMIGRRWNVEISEPLDFDKDLARQIRAKKPEGALSKDYFVFTKGIYRSIPPFALGRGEWDHWMMAEALMKKAAVVDASEVTRAIHQNHDFKHIKGVHIKRGKWGPKGEENKHNKALIPKKHPPYSKLKTTHKIVGNKIIKIA